MFGFAMIYPYKPKIIEKAIAWPFVAPVAAGVAQVGAPPVVAVKTCPVVPAAVATGAAPAPPPYTTPYCDKAAEDAQVVPLLKYGTPPEVPAIVSAGVVVGLATETMPPVQPTVDTVPVLLALEASKVTVPAAFSQYNFMS
jgi:hypothetical protein